MFGLPSLGIGLKLATLFGNWWMRVVAILLAVAAVGFVSWRTVTSVRDWQTASYNDGFKAGSDMQEARWQKQAASNFEAQRDQVVADAKRNNQSVSDYLSDVASSRSAMDQVRKEVIQYEKSSAGAAACLDDNGVRILLTERTALGLTRDPGPVPAAPGAVH